MGSMVEIDARGTLNLPSELPILQLISLSTYFGSFCEHALGTEEAENQYGKLLGIYFCCPTLVAGYRLWYRFDFLLLLCILHLLAS